MFAVCMCVPMEGLDQPGWYHQSSELLGESTNNIDMQTRVSGMRCCSGYIYMCLLEPCRTLAHVLYIYPLIHADIFH